MVVHAQPRTSSAGGLFLRTLSNPPISTWATDVAQPPSTHSARDGRWSAVVVSLVPVQRFRGSGLGLAYVLPIVDGASDVMSCVCCC